MAYSAGPMVYGDLYNAEVLMGLNLCMVAASLRFMVVRHGACTRHWLKMVVLATRGGSGHDL